MNNGKYNVHKLHDPASKCLSADRQALRIIQEATKSKIKAYQPIIDGYTNI